MTEKEPSERLLETFLELARIASPSFDEEAIAERVVSLLEDAGCEVRIDASARTTGANTGNVIAILPASGAGKTIVLSAHLDTVKPADGIEPTVEDGVVRSAGDTVLGADDKVGVAVIVEALRRLSESGRPHGEVRAVLTVAEEKGLVGAKALDESDVAGDLCLVLDADGDPGGIVIGSPTHYTFSARFVGQAAHAGVQPEKGTSAIVMAARAISRMPQGRIDEETTANVGRIEGGTATNIVTPTVDISGECRSRDRVRVEEVRASMHDAMEKAAREVGGRVDITWVKEYDAVRFDEDDPLLELVREACEDAGVEPHCFMTGGGSDANILCSMGVPALALASGMRDVHTVDESVAVEDIERLLEVVMAVIRRATE